EAREILRAVLCAKRSERPADRVLIVGILLERLLEARALGKESAPHDAKRERGILSLQEADRGVDGRKIALFLREERCDDGPLAERPARKLGDHALEALAREKSQHELERRIGLRHVVAQAPEVTRQIRRGGVRRVEL